MARSRHIRRLTVARMVHVSLWQERLGMARALINEGHRIFAIYMSHSIAWPFTRYCSSLGQSMHSQKLPPLANPLVALIYEAITFPHPLFFSSQRSSEPFSASFQGIGALCARSS